jgi:hypothetical protein
VIARRRLDDALETELLLREEFGVLRPRSLAAGVHREHLDVEQLCN